MLEGVVAIFSGKAGTVVIRLAATPFVVRLLGAEGYGIYATVFAVFGLATTITDAGFFDGSRKHIVEDRHEGWRDEVFAFYFRTGVFVALLAAGILAVAIYTGVVGSLFGSQLDIYFGILGVMIITRQTFLIGRGVLMGVGEERVSEPLTVLQVAIFMGGGLVLALSGWGVVGFLLSHLLGDLIIATIAYVRISTYLSVRSLVKPVPEAFPTWELLSFNGYSIALSVLIASLTHLDILLIQTFRSSAETGYYKVALVVSGFVVFVPIGIEIAFVHLTSEIWQHDTPEEVTRLTARVTKYNLLFSGIVTIGLTALAREFVLLYFGPEFTPAIPAILLLLPGSLALALARPIIATGQGSGKLRTLVIFVAGAALLNLVGNLLLIPRFGLVGAAIATSLGYCATFLVSVIGAREIGFNPVRGLPLRRLAATMATAFVVIYGLEILIPSDLLSLLVVPVVGSVSFVVIAFGFRTIKTSEVRHLVDMI